MYILGIDIGSTSIKAVIYNYHREIVSIGRQETRLHTAMNERGAEEAFWLPEDIWNRVAMSVKEAINKIEKPDGIKGLAVSGFGSDGVPVNSEGQCLYPFISWHDTKTTEQLNIFKELINDEEVYKITGTKPWYFHTILRNMWIKKYKPEVYNKIYKWMIVTDYVNYKLCGAIATDYSEASTTLVLDQNKLDWSEKLFDLTDIDINLYPKPVKSGTIIGEVSKEASEKTGLNAGTPVVLGGHDNICSYFAASDSSANFIVSVTGTFESNLISVNVPVINIDGMNANLVCEKSVISDEYILWGAQYACANIEWFKKIFLEIQDHTADEHSISSSILKILDGTEVGSHGVFMLPDILGSICPVDDPNSRGVFIGISEKSTRGDFLRAIIEGINYRTLSICNTIENVTESKITKIINIGGAAYNHFWMQNRADILGKIVEVPDIKEATSLGTALLAGIGVGIYIDFNDAVVKSSRKVKIYYPDDNNHEKYKKYYNDIFYHLHASTKQLNNSISEMK